MGTADCLQAATDTAREVAALLDFSENHVWELEKTRRLPLDLLRLGDRLVFPKGAVDAVPGRLLAIAERVALLAHGFSDLHALLIAATAALMTEAGDATPPTQATEDQPPRRRKTNGLPGHGRRAQGP